MLYLLFCVIQWLLKSRIVTTEEGWKLVWADEFDGNEIDPTTWSLMHGDGCDINLCKWGNNELQWYTNTSDNAFVENGRLVLQAKREEGNFERPYNSARMVTEHKRDWRFGKIEIRAKFPIADGTGVWPIIWLMSTYEKYGYWPACGSFDVAVMNAPNGKVLTASHFGRAEDPIHLQRYNLPPNGTLPFDEDFHVFSILWERGSIHWYIDGVPSGSLTKWIQQQHHQNYPFDEKFHLILNLAVGGHVVGDPSKTMFPKRLEIDYVRIFQML